MKRTIATIIHTAGLISATIVLAGCGEAATGAVGAAPEAVVADQAAGTDAATIAPTAAATDATPAPAAAQALTDSDRMALQSIDAACRAGDFNQFLFLFSHNAAARARHIAAEVSVGDEASPRRVSRSDYLAGHRFPVQVMDYTMYTAQSVDQRDRDPDVRLQPVAWVVNTAGDNRRRIEWAAGVFDGSGEEGPGRLLRLTAPSGVIHFSPTDTCWELRSDLSPVAADSIDADAIMARFNGRGG